jgi:hypothetical protein
MEKRKLPKDELEKLRRRFSEGQVDQCTHCVFVLRFIKSFGSW